MAETALSSGHLPRELLLGIEVAGLLVVVLALIVARAAWVMIGVAVLAVAEGAVLAIVGPGAWAPILGMLLLLGAELALWSIECSRAGRETAAVGRYRAIRLLGLALVGAAGAVLVVAGSDLPLTGSLDLTVLGVLAAIAISAVVLWLARDALGEPLGREGG
ncbi:MAG: hypothetical protein WBA31_04120 [Candidatus Dormiibacterota bacterium]